MEGMLLPGERGGRVRGGKREAVVEEKSVCGVGVGGRLEAECKKSLGGIGEISGRAGLEGDVLRQS